MDDPLFRRRAKLAERMNTHPFDPSIMAMDHIQLFISHQQIMKDESEKMKNEIDVHKVWAEKLDALFKNLYIFTNPKMYKHFEEQKEMQGLREDVQLEEFSAVWEEIMSTIPNELEVDEDGKDGLNLPKATEEDEAFFTGFLSGK